MMAMLHVTTHAIHRYQERVANVDDEQARIAMSVSAVARAAAFGAPYVKLGTGHRFVLDGWNVVTVLPPETELWRLGTRKPCNTRANSCHTKRDAL